MKIISLINRRRFVQLLLSAGAMLSISGRWLSGVTPGKLKVLVSERKDHPGLDTWGSTAWVDNQSGAAHMLELANFDVDELDMDRAFDRQTAELLVIGSYVSCHDDVVSYIETNGSAIKKFVYDGGVVLQLVEAPPYDQFYLSDRPKRETSELFLPSSFSVKRSRETFWDLYVRDREHPLLAGFDMGAEDEPKLDLSDRFEETASWMAIAGHNGFKVLVSHTPDDSRSALLEASYGKGRYIISSFFFDKLFGSDGEPVRPAFVQASRRFFSNLHDYTARVTQGLAPAVVPGRSYEDPPPADFTEGSFTLVVIPDTQMYCFHKEWNFHFHNISDWIIRERQNLNIKYVLHVGDLVHRGGQDPPQWHIAQQAMRKLDGLIPYAIAPGNHDYTDGRSHSRATPLNDYFHPGDYESWPTFGGCMTPDHLESTWHTFRAHDTGFLILALEFWPRDHVIEWANRIVEAHPDHRVILNTHAYLYSDSRRYNFRDREERQRWNPRHYLSEGGANDGQDLWEKLVSQHPNFIMTLNGHVLNDGLGRKTSPGKHENTVHQMLVNYQSYYQGGEGLIRLLHFLPDKRTVQVRTVSTSSGRFRTGSQEQFRLELSSVR